MAMFLKPCISNSSDIARIAEWMLAESWPGRDKALSMSEVELREIVDLPNHDSYCLFAAENELLGFGQVWTDLAGRPNLVRILVNPAKRNQGIGKVLSKMLLNEALRKSAGGLVRLRVRADNLAAIAVYQSLGFANVPEDSNPASITLSYKAKRLRVS